MSESWRFAGAPDASQADAIAATLLRGGVVLLPTDTIYGLHAVASDAAAVDRIVAMKGRDETKPLIVLASSIAQVRALGVTAPAGQLETLAALWPAPLTVILPLEKPVPASRGAATLAIRIPALAWLHALIERTGPLVSTSANRSGEPPVEEISTLAQGVQDHLDGIADAGRSDGKPSAILDLTGTEPRFIRKGDHSFTQLVRKSLLKTS